MKKIILTVAAVFAFGFANAQDKKESKGSGFSEGSIFVSGAFGISSSSQDEDKSTSFEIEPKVGFFVTPNIALGAKLGYESYKAEDAFGDTDDENTLSIGVFGRYYATPSNQFSIFGQLGFDYMSTNDKMSEVKTNGFGLAFKPGISYFVSDAFAIEATFGELSYTSVKDDTDGAEAKNTFSLGLDLRSINFGLLYKF
ncbi:outer membrane beta-barrel protein [Flavobacterium terrisoli]|uniref:outer membrane beta-barrel protein n=1 Tax=Flavobacterium terrisoli TaxID=3242195 RepID=UPI002543937D|nr:outer membrane beta-barrel protein [Flavobacterium buctense]